MKNTRSAIVPAAAFAFAVSACAAPTGGPEMSASEESAERELDSTIQLSLANGESSASLSCSCSDLPFIGCARGHRVDKDVEFILPPGYVKHGFSEDVQPGGANAGGSVGWLVNDPHDTRVHLHCWADAFSNATVTVSLVTATLE